MNFEKTRISEIMFNVFNYLIRYFLYATEKYVNVSYLVSYIRDTREKIIYIWV